MHDGMYLRKITELSQENCELGIEIAELKLKLEKAEMCPCFYDDLFFYEDRIGGFLALSYPVSKFFRLQYSFNYLFFTNV